jgi:hypothetical protein
VHFGRLLFLLPVALLGACQAVSDLESSIGIGGTPDAGKAVSGAKDTKPASKPPALKFAKAATPALPDLPSLAAHEAPAQAPATVIAEGQPCHAVWTGSDAAPLACAKSLLFGSDDGSGAKLIVPRKLLARNPLVLPAVVDHRAEGTEGPLRNQGTAPACTAFATAAALDHAMARWSGRVTPVSVMQIWSRYHSPFVETSLQANLGQPMGPEASWPFDVNEAVAWVPCQDFAKPPKGGCGKPVNTTRAQQLSASPLGHFTEVEFLGAPPDTQMLMSKIAAGQDVILTMELPAAFVPVGKAGSRYIPHYTKSAGPDAGHAMLVAGYAHLPHGTYFLLHNSWGPGWGDGGYAWIHEATVQKWAREVVAVDAEPLARDPGSRSRRQRGEVICDAGTVPDSITGMCAPACPDHSPRHEGVCPIANQCPASYVNLTGACVLAAPVVRGTDPDTNVSWSCGPGGCVYALPRASDPACTGNTCEASCPAPDFHLAKMGAKMVCVE